jgi:hypothetical protein
MPMVTRNDNQQFDMSNYSHGTYIDRTHDCANHMIQLAFGDGRDPRNDLGHPKDTTFNSDQTQVDGWGTCDVDAGICAGADTTSRTEDGHYHSDEAHGDMMHEAIVSADVEEPGFEASVGDHDAYHRVEGCHVNEHPDERSRPLGNVQVAWSTNEPHISNTANPGSSKTADNYAGEQSYSIPDDILAHENQAEVGVETTGMMDVPIPLETAGVRHSVSVSSPAAEDEYAGSDLLPDIRSGTQEDPASALMAPPDKSEEELDEEAKTGQWHVGKRPGHQGSYVKWNGDSSPEKRGEKRTLSEVSAESFSLLRRLCTGPWYIQQVLP